MSYPDVALPHLQYLVAANDILTLVDVNQTRVVSVKTQYIASQLTKVQKLPSYNIELVRALFTFHSFESQSC
jgi:hypothetical protein